MSDYEQKPPVEAGDIIEEYITGIGNGGDPIIHISGYAVILKNAQEMGLQRGDEVRIKITKALPKFGFAEVLE